MAYEQKEGQGSLFKNDKKQKPNHPEYKGSITIGGKKYWLSAWVKDKEGKKWMSLAAQDAGKKPEGDDIPF